MNAPTTIDHDAPDQAEERRRFKEGMIVGFVGSAAVIALFILLEAVFGT